MPNLSYRYLLISIFCLLPALCFAQKTYDGQVIDKATEDPIPGVNILLIKEKTGTQTNDQGYFELSSEKILPADTLQFSSVGYKTFKLPLSEYEPQIIITLEGSNTELNEVRIANKKKLKDIVLGQFSYYDLKDYVSANGTHSHHSELIINRTIVAKLLTAPKRNMVLRTISMGRQDFPSAPSGAIRNKYTNFVLHIIMPDSITGAPGKVLLTKNISLTNNLKFVNIDMSDQKVIIPGTNFFIGVEWINNPFNEIIAVNNAPKIAKTTRRGWQVEKDASEYWVYYQPFLVGYTNEKTLKPALLYTRLNNQWEICKQYRMGDIALSATMHYQ